MSKKPRRKHKKVLLLTSIVSFLTLVGLTLVILNPYINISLISNIFPFFSLAPKNGSTPFYGENIDMSQILPTSQHYIVNSKGQDLIDVAADLGVNLIRITNATRSFNNNADSLYTKGQWDQVLNKMQRKRIKALILIETASDNKDYYNLEIQPIYLHIVREYINSGVFSHPDVYAVDIKNESLLTDTNVSMLQAAHTIIKAKYPHLKQTVGWWAGANSLKDPYHYNNYNWTDYSGGQKLDSIVDFYSVHLYGLSTPKFGITLGPNLKTKLFLSEVENGLQTKKPILVEEFGEANGSTVSDQDTIGSPYLQANVYQGFYQALKEMNSRQVIGSVAFDFYSRDQYPDAWAIVKNNGDYLFPAAYILQEYALGKNNASLETATIVTTQSYLAKNDSNRTTKNLHVSDRIGLKLQLDSSKSYSLSLTRHGSLVCLETFHYNARSHSYQAVYQATSKGTVQISIISNPDNAVGVNNTVPQYILRIIIQ